MKIKNGLHWTTVVSEKAIIALIGVCTLIAVADYVYGMWAVQQVSLADLFMLFIFAEVVAMIGAFYTTERIPVTLPIINPQAEVSGLISSTSRYRLLGVGPGKPELGPVSCGLITLSTGSSVFGSRTTPEDISGTYGQ